MNPMRHGKVKIEGGRLDCSKSPGGSMGTEASGRQNVYMYRLAAPPKSTDLLDL